MNRIYHLSTCDTCRKILSEIKTEGFELQNIREESIDKNTLQWLRSQVGSYEALFNKRAQKLKEMTPEQKPQKDTDYKRLIISDYTFIKRPIIICGEDLYIGNEKATVERLKKDLGK
jgi:arsenate reductase (glutaredoxin)